MKPFVATKLEYVINWVLPLVFMSCTESTQSSWVYKTPEVGCSGQASRYIRKSQFF